jgi:hypothetical protein
VRSDHHHANSFWTAPSLCADMIFGKDRGSRRPSRRAPLGGLRLGRVEAHLARERTLRHRVPFVRQLDYQVRRFVRLNSIVVQMNGAMHFVGWGFVLQEQSFMPSGIRVIER